MERVDIKKQGIFYNVYGDDCYIISYLSGYKITNGRLGFPLNSIDKIKDLLDDNNINYIVDDCEMTFDKNKYKKYLKLGKNSYQEMIDKNNLVKSINNLSGEKVRQIMKYVNYIIYK